MKVHPRKNFTLRYIALNDFPAECEVRFFKRNGTFIILVSDVGVGPGVSNNIEMIATALAQQGHLWDMLVEHYPAIESIVNVSFHRIQLRWNDEEKRFEDPVWTTIREDEFHALIGGTLS